MFLRLRGWTLGFALCIRKDYARLQSALREIVVSCMVNRGCGHDMDEDVHATKRKPEIGKT